MTGERQKMEEYGIAWRPLIIIIIWYLYSTTPTKLLLMLYIKSIKIRFDKIKIKIN